MSIKGKTSVDTTQGSIGKQILLFFFPILFGSVFQQLYNTADAVIVGNFVGKEALAAVGGSTGTIINLFVGFFVGIASGFSIIISQHFGAKHNRDIRECVHTAVAFSFLSGLFISVLGYFGTNIFLRYLKVPEDIFPMASTYLRIIFLGMCFNLVYNMGASILRSIGDSKTPLVFLIISCFVNIVLDLLFVLYCKMGVMGAALATIASQALSALLVLHKLSSSEDIYKLHIRQIRIYPYQLKKMFSLGIAAGLQSIMYTSANIVIQASVNQLGVDSIAAYSAFSKMDPLYWMSMQALSISITTVAGQNYGANNKLRVQKTFYIALLMGILITGIAGLSFFTFGRPLLSLFNRDESVIAVGLRVIGIMALSYPLYIILDVYSSILRSTGDVWIPMFMLAFGIWSVRITWIFLMFPRDMRIETIIYAYPLSWACTSILFLVYMHFFSPFWKWVRGKT